MEQEDQVAPTPSKEEDDEDDFDINDYTQDPNNDPSGCNDMSCECHNVSKEDVGTEFILKGNHFTHHSLIS